MQYVVGSDIKEDEFYVLDVVTPNVDDVYYDIDIYGEAQAPLEEYINLSPETIAAYTDFAPRLCPLREVSMLTAESGFSALHHRFLDGQLSAQEYMQAVQRVLRMMALEE